MPNTQLGSFTYDMLLQTASFEDALSKAQAAAATTGEAIRKQIQSSVDGLTDSLENIAGAVVAAFSFDKLVQFGASAVAAAQQVQNLSQSLGVLTQSVQALGFAAAIGGSSLDNITGSLEKLEKSAVQASSGNAQMSEAFRAIGVSVTDATGALKPADQLFQEVAQHLSQAADGPTKVAVAIELMGRGAAQQIPFLNAFGQSSEEMADQAKALGVVLSGPAQASLVQFKESLDLLGQTQQGVANQMMAALAPALTEITARMQIWLASGDAKSWGDAIASAITTVMNLVDNMSVGFTQAFATIDQTWNTFKVDGESAILIVQFAWDTFVSDLKNGAVDASATLTKLSQGSLFGPMADAIDNAAAAAKTAGPSYDDLTAKLSALRSGMLAYDAASQDAVTQAAADVSANQAAAASVVAINAALATYHAELGQKGADAAAIEMTALKSLDTIQQQSNATGSAAVVVNNALQKATDDVTGSFDRATAPTLVYDAAVKTLKATADDSGGALDAFAATVDKLIGTSGGPAEKAFQDYQAGLINLQLAADKAAIAGADVNVVIALQNQGIAALGETYQNAFEKILTASDYFTKIDDAFNTQIASIKGLSEADQVQEQYLKDLKTAQDALTAAFGQGVTVTDAEKTAILANAQAHVELINQTKLDVEAAKQWQSIWITAGDGVATEFAKVLVEGGSLFDGLKSLAQQTVEAIISYFVKLAVINPILNSVFGGQAGFSMLPQLGESAASGAVQSAAGSAVGGGGISGGIGNIFSGLESSFNNFTSSINGMASSWLNWGTNEGLMTSGVGVDASSDALGLVPDYASMGTDFGTAGADAFTDSAGTYGTTLGADAGSSFLSTVGPVLGGAMLGYQVGGVGGAIALGAVAYMVPIVGWIAGAISLVNTITGGGLLGTSWAPTGNTALNISSSSTGITAGATAEESKKGALFSGREWKTTAIPLPDGTQSGLDTFFTTLQTGLTSFAKQFGITTANVVSSTFNQTFNKSGAVTGSTTTIAGQTYSGDTAAQYQERLQADSFLAVLDQMGLGASAFVAGVQGDADTLFAAVQDFAAATQEANTNLNNGFKFMALSADQTLPDVMKFVEGLEQSGETLQQAYERLAQAQQSYNTFVAQFTPATYVDPFEQSLSTLFSQEKGALAQANALAQAAGAAGANTTDLTAIITNYSQQMAALTVQTEASAQSLAFSLGLTTQGTLDQVNQEISALGGDATSATSSVSGFGDAIKATAAKATDAMNLMLGDLSPLNDTQKLQLALQGLRAGTVTADQVLTIGRQLYASSDAYTQLFNEVKQYNAVGTGSKGTGGGSSSSSSSSSTGGFTTADLPALEAQRDALEKAQTLNQFQTLAQQVAEIASAKGEDYTQVLQELGIKQADLEKGLGITNDANMAAYISQLQQQQDSAGQNTTSLINAILSLPAGIAAALTGTPIDGPNGPITVAPPSTGSTVNPTATSSAAGANSPSNVPPGSGGSGGRFINPGEPPLSTQIANGVSKGVAPVLATIAASNRRNIRWLNA